MDNFAGKIAVITGGGSAWALSWPASSARRLPPRVVHLGADALAETKRLCEGSAPNAIRVTTHLCDVAEEAQVMAFRDAVVAEHRTEHVNLFFNNAGIGGGGSFLRDSPEQWEKTFDVCWYGVYFGSRAFLPLLVASSQGHLVNTSSVNGFWASAGPNRPHTAYAAAKFAVKGFSEALVTELRNLAPHVLVCVVMSGHIGTSILANRVLDQMVRDTPEEAYEASFAERLGELGVLRGILE